MIIAILIFLAMMAYEIYDCAKINKESELEDLKYFEELDKKAVDR